MSVLLWWLIPLVATLAALAWAAIRVRPAKPVDPAAGMAERERFREAMSRPLPTRDTGRRDGRRNGPSVDDDLQRSA